MNTDRHLPDSAQPLASSGIFSRRAAIGRLAACGLATAALATTGRDRASAQATPAPPEDTGQEPNGFVLDGPGTHISYGTTSEDGRPTLTYRGSAGEHTFVGDDIHLEQSATLGQLVSVLLDAAPDAYTLWLTLLLPSFNPVELSDPPIPFTTLAILTTHPTTIGGTRLIDGPLQTYEVIALTGTALFAVS
jgi:hypothetical protein